MPARSLIPSFAAIRSLLAPHRAGLLVIISAWAIGLVLFGTDGQALGMVDAGGQSKLYASDCLGYASVSPAGASPSSEESDKVHLGGMFAYAGPENARDAARLCDYDQ